MQERAEPPSRSILVIPASIDQQPILANLFELYIHDFSEWIPVELGPDGRFGYRNLPDYWGQPDHHPFLITVDDQLAGFTLVKKTRSLTNIPAMGEQETWDMAEFFVVRAHRKRGVGKTAAHQIWRQLPGSWQVRVMHSNSAALIFWQRAIDDYSGHSVEPVSIEREGKTWAVFKFQS